MTTAAATQTRPAGFLSDTWSVALRALRGVLREPEGNPAAVSTSFILFFPFAFLTTSFLPKEALTGWLATVSDYNPVTYLLGGMRSLLLSGWDGQALAEGFGAIVGVGVVSMTLAMLALRGRVRRG